MKENKMKSLLKQRFIFIGILLKIFFSDPGWAGSVPQNLGDFGSWRALVPTPKAGVEKNKSCLVMSSNSLSSSQSKEGAFVFMSETQGPSLVFMSALPLSSQTPVQIQVGKETFPFMAQMNRAYLKDPSLGPVLLKELEKGETVTLRATAHKGTEVRQTYPLSGFGKALQACQKHCSRAS